MLTGIADIRGIALMDIQRDDFDLPILGPVLESMHEQVVNGRGFVWIRGVPVHRYTRLQSAIKMEQIAEPYIRRRAGMADTTSSTITTSTSDWAVSAISP